MKYLTWFMLWLDGRVFRHRNRFICTRAWSLFRQHGTPGKYHTSDPRYWERLKR